jgi:hypothetical protein
MVNGLKTAIFRLCRFMGIRLSFCGIFISSRLMTIEKGLFMSRFMIKSGFLVAIFILCGANDNWALDFRIENRVFVEKEKVPQSRSLTLFQAGMVYDFMFDPSEVTIFDKSAGRFVLLNMAKQEQTEVTTAEIDAFIEKLKRLADKQKDPLSKFFADPKFEERFDAASGELSLTSPWVSYRMITEAAKDPAISAEYRDFSDGYSRLNAMLNPGSRPPMARLQVNQALAGREVLAREVNLTMTSIKDDIQQKTVLRSEHDFSANLSASDLDQIRGARESRDKFKMVPYDKYKKNRRS